jgi:hypothetical protein
MKRRSGGGWMLGAIVTLGAAGGDGCSNGGAAPPRTMITRPLTLGSTQNLLLDPFVGGEYKAGWGHFVADAHVTLSRTFLSASPVGGAVSVERLGASQSPAGTSAATLRAPFLGGPGSFHAAVWVAADDPQGHPLPFANVAGSVSATIASADGAPAAVLTAGPPQTFGGREWVHLATTPDLTALPGGGWMTISVSNLGVTWLLAAPEVLSSALPSPDVAP